MPVEWRHRRPRHARTCAALLIEAAQAILRCSRIPWPSGASKLLATQRRQKSGRGGHRPQTDRGCLVSHDGPLDTTGRNRRASESKSWQNDQLSWASGAQIFRQNPPELSAGDLPITQGRPGLCVEPIQNIYTQVRRKPPAGLAQTGTGLWRPLVGGPPTGPLGARSEPRKKERPAQIGDYPSRRPTHQLHALGQRSSLESSNT